MGLKVFLNTFSSQFGYAPTKVRMFLAHSPDGNTPCLIEEIPLKVVSDKRLLHYGVTEDSTIFIMASNDLIASSNLKIELKSLA